MTPTKAKPKNAASRPPRKKKITGSAALFKKKILKWTGKDTSSDKARQREAYSYWDDIPEVRFSAIWVGRGMSKARLFAGERQPDGTVKEVGAEHPATELVSTLGGGVAGLSQFLEAFGPHLVVGGESWVIVRPKEADNEYDEWHVASSLDVEDGRNKDELKVRLVIDGQEQEIIVPPNDDNTDPNSPLAIRIWNPHPARSIRSDSPVMSAGVILDELRLLNAAVAAIARSRLAGRGILAVPEGASLPDGDDLLERIMDVAEIAYKDPASAAAMIPILLEIPRGETSKLEHIKFESAFDELAIKLREEAIRRYATASDVPAEVLLGQADINHWGVWALRDEAIEVGIEPRLATICDGLTSQWLWPALQEKQVDAWGKIIVWYDTSGMRVRTNRSATAIELGKDGVLKDSAVRRESGFDDDDAPSANSVRLSMYLKAAAAVPDLATDSTVQARILELLQAVDQEAEQTSSSDGSSTELPVGETHAPPEQPATPPTGPNMSTDALVASIDSLIVRALERAGNRLRTSRPRSEWDKLKELSVSTYHTEIIPTLSEIDGLRLLEGAWERLPEIASRYDVSESCLVELLESYTRDLLLSGESHSYSAVPLLVEEASCLQPA